MKRNGKKRKETKRNGKNRLPGCFCCVSVCFSVQGGLGGGLGGSQQPHTQSDAMPHDAPPNTHTDTCDATPCHRQVKVFGLVQFKLRSKVGCNPPTKFQKGQKVHKFPRKVSRQATECSKRKRMCWYAADSKRLRSRSSLQVQEKMPSSVDSGSFPEVSSEVWKKCV